MSDRQTFVIAGAGLAGAKAAETLRSEGFDGRVVLVGTETGLPYERPPLSKSYLMGESSRADAEVHPPEFYAEHDIELLEGVTATALDPGAHRLTLDNAGALDYDRLLLTTGAVPRRPPLDGIDLAGVRLLRAITDSDALRSRFEQDGAAVAIIGAGWIGCEVAAAARTLGAQVTLIEMAATPLETVLGAEIGGFFGDVHRSHDVDLRTSARVARIVGDTQVAGVALGDGTTVACDTVVVGVGVAPDTRLAETAGLELDNGIAVDEQLRTSDPDIFAAGDVANALHPRYGRRIRVEHWANALNQGPAAARSMLDRGEPYARLPYFFSDQYDIGMEYTGLHAPTDRLVVQGQLDPAGFRAFWVGPDGKATAGMHVNQWDEGIEPIKELIERGGEVTPSPA